MEKKLTKFFAYLLGISLYGLLLIAIMCVLFEEPEPSFSNYNIEEWEKE